MLLCSQEEEAVILKMWSRLSSFPPLIKERADVSKASIV